MQVIHLKSILMCQKSVLPSKPYPRPTLEMQNFFSHVHMTSKHVSDDLLDPGTAYNIVLFIFLVTGFPMGTGAMILKHNMFLYQTVSPTPRNTILQLLCMTLFYPSLKCLATSNIATFTFSFQVRRKSF